MKDPRYPYALDLGTEVAGYRILDILGAGGFGITYKAFNDVTHKTVAIKEFYVRDISSRTGATVVVDTAVSEGTYEYALEKFQEEAKSVVNRFQHTYIIRGENFIRWNNTCYLVMEYVEGVNFEQWLSARSDPPSEAELRDVFEKIFEAVDYVHERNTMHRDLTPRNIMIRPSGDPVLIDFGAAGQGIDRDRSSKMVAQMRYAPPEQTDSEGPGQHGRYTDIYSLGAVFYRAVTGAPPIASVTRVMRMGRRAGSGADPFVPARDAALQPERYSARFLEGIDRALSLEETERPQTISELRAALGWSGSKDFAATPARSWVEPDDGSSRTVSFSHATPRTGVIRRPQDDPQPEARRPSRNVDLGKATSERVSVITNGAGHSKVVVSDGPVVVPPRRGLPVALIAAAVAGVLVAALAIFALLRPGAEPGPAPGAYGLTASRDAGGIRLTGFAPSESARQALQDSVARAISGVQITNQIRIADGAPPGYADIAGLALGSLADLGNGSVKVEGRDILIEGTASTPDGYRTLIRDYGRPLPGGWQTRVAIRPAEVSPFVFAIDLEPGRAVISGHVPDEALRARVVDAARRALSGRSIQDDTRIAGGAPANFPELAAFAADRIGDLSQGRIAINGSDLRIEGRARSTETYATLKAATVPGGRVAAAVRPPLVQPFDLAVKIETDTVILSGFAPTDEAKSELSAAAARVARGRTVRDELRIADGAPPDFQAAARFAIDQIPRLASGRVALSGRSLTVDGQIAGSSDFAELGRALANVPPGFVLERNTVGAPRISPYPWSASLGAGAVRLSGFVPSEAARQEVLGVARAALGGAAIDDEMQIGDGAPAAFTNSVRLALAQLPRLAGGRVSIEDSTLAVEGTAATPESHAAILRDLGRALPGGGNARLTGLAPAIVAPYQWAAEIGPGRLRLSGYVPSEDVRAQIAETLRRSQSGQPATDQTLVAAGAPTGFGEAAAYAVGRLGDLADGKASIIGGELRLEGRARSFDAFSQATARAGEAVPGGLRLLSDIRPPIASPFEWTVTCDVGSVVISGFAPSAEAKSELAAAVTTAARGRFVRDESRIADGAPAEFLAAARQYAGLAGRLQRGRLALRDQTITLEGQASASAEYEELRRAAATPAPSGFRVVRYAIDPPRISPYVWSVTVAPGSARIAGYVPSDAIRRDLAQTAAAALPGTSAADETGIADGAPDQFAALARFGLTQAGRLASGRVTLDDGQLGIEGTAASPEAHAALLRDLQRPPAGTAVARVAVTPATAAPFTFAAEIGASRVRLTGYLPGDDVRQQVLDLVRRSLPGSTIVDDTKPARGQVAGFSDTVAFGLARLGDLSEGRVSVSDNDLRIEGRARTSDVYQAMAALGRDLAPGGARVTAAVRPPLAAPFDWSLSIDGDSVAIGGAVPSDDIRRELAAQVARATGRQPRDDTRIADGAPADFAAAARLAADQAPRLSRGRIGISDKAITVDGQSVDGAAFEQLRRATAPAVLPQGFRVARFSVNAPVISPYSWRLTKQGPNVRISGFMPSDSVRRELVAAATQVPGWRVTDELQIGDGAPDRFLDTIRLAMAQVPRLESGTVGIVDSAVALEGTAATPDAYAAILQDFTATLPSGGRARLDVKPALVTPFVWNAKVERGTVRLTGYVTSEEERRRIADDLKAVLPRGVDIRDDTRVAAGASADFSAATAFAAQRVAELAEGSVAIGDHGLKVTGIARSQASYQSLQDAVTVAALPSGLAIDHDVEAPKPAEIPAVRTPDKPDRAIDKVDRPERPDRTDKPDRNDKPDRPTRPTRPSVDRDDPPSRPTNPRRPRRDEDDNRPPRVAPLIIRPSAPRPPPTFAGPRPAPTPSLSNCAASRC